MTGEPEQAIAALGRLLEGPSVWSIETLLLDPRSEPLRDHPDFEALVVRYRRSG